MSCVEYHQALALAVEGDLDAEGQDQLDHHLEGCADCRQFEAELRASQRAIGAWAAEGVDEALLADIRTGLTARLDREARPRRPAKRWLATAAGLLLALLAGLSLRHQRTADSLTEVTEVTEALAVVPDTSADTSSTVPSPEVPDTSRDRTPAASEARSAATAPPSASRSRPSPAPPTAVADRAPTAPPVVLRPAEPQFIQWVLDDPPTVIYWQLDPDPSEEEAHDVPAKV